MGDRAAKLNLSLFVALTAQFQTYCRGLHDEAIDVHVHQATGTQQALLRTLLSQNRKLDAGTPRVSALGSDYGRLGFNLVDALKNTAPELDAWLHRLDVLVAFRNAMWQKDRVGGHRFRRRDPGDEGVVRRIPAAAQPARRYHGWSGGIEARQPAADPATVVKGRQTISENELSYGDEVLVPWGLDDVRGTVQEVYGRVPKLQVVVMLTPELSGSIVDEPTTVTMPIAAVKRVAPAA